MEGSLSVLSTPTGIFVTVGNNSVTTEAAVPFRNSVMKGWLAGVVTTVTDMERRSRSLAKCRRGMVCPFDMNGKRRTWERVPSEGIRPISFTAYLSLLLVTSLLGDVLGQNSPDMGRVVLAALSFIGYYIPFY